MTNIDPRTWLLLIHQIPPKPDALRVRVWRRLQRVGAVAIKPSVYALPFSEQAREDFSWTLKEIVAGGGNGSVSEARFVEGLTDEQVVVLFQSARKADYEKIIEDAERLLADWSCGQGDPQDPAAKGPAQVSRLRRSLDEVAAIDFFQAPQRESAERLLKDLAACLSVPAASLPSAAEDEFYNLKGKTWVTRNNLFVDRIACAWLIRRFVDDAAAFKFVDATSYTPVPGELRFDMFDGEYTHEGDRCTFEVMIQRFGLRDRALAALAEVVHDIDLKDTKYDRSETDGFNALLSGLAACLADDERRMTEGFLLFENLYAYFQGHKGEDVTSRQ